MVDFGIPKVFTTSTDRWDLRPKHQQSAMEDGYFRRGSGEAGAGEEIDDSWEIFNGEQCNATLQHGAWWKSPNSDAFGYKL